MTGVQVVTYLVFHVGEKNIPDHCNDIDIQHTVSSWHQEEVDGLRRWPDEPVKLETKTRNQSTVSITSKNSAISYGFKTNIY